MDFEDFEVDWLIVGILALVVLSFVVAKVVAEKYGLNKGQDHEYQKHLLGQALGTISPYEDYKPKPKPQETNKPAAVEDNNDNTNTLRGRRARKED
ncbi:hypothetical protein, conserved [Angomonas deanei]|uniref:Uncharacterized protein n=1 Tax=Angomonas deanei TaxID=59799 RepID=A0A7G2CH94_9TRYP|nr:hypothetical protein, conserved [Angomonas deanei]